MFIVIYILQRFERTAQVGTFCDCVSDGSCQCDQYERPPYELRVSSRHWKTFEAAQHYADGVSKDRKAFVVQLPKE